MYDDFKSELISPLLTSSPRGLFLKTCSKKVNGVYLLNRKGYIMYNNILNHVTKQNTGNTCVIVVYVEEITLDNTWLGGITLEHSTSRRIYVRMNLKSPIFLVVYHKTISSCVLMSYVFELWVIKYLIGFGLSARSIQILSTFVGG